MVRRLVKLGVRIATKPLRMLRERLAPRPAAGARPSPPPPAPEPEPSPFDLQVDPQELVDRVRAGAEIQFVDVRQADELAWSGTIPGALHVPTQDLPRRLGELDRDKEIVLFCAAGARSLDAAAYLQEQGFPRVFSLGGGLPAWRDRGGDVTGVD